MTIIYSIIVFLIIFSVLVLIHELGHFVMARKAGVKVEEFGFGLPPRAWGKETSRWIKIKGKNGKMVRKKEIMIWSINWIPFGGFVRMLGEDDTSKESKKDPRSFGNRPILWRIGVVIAGVVMNFLLGWFLLTFAFSVGAEPLILDANDIEQNIARGIIETSNGVYLIEPTAESGLEAGDVITYVDQTPVNNLQEIEDVLVKGKMGSDFHFRVIRNEEELVELASPETAENLGVFSSLAPLKEIHKIKLPVHKAALYAGRETARASVVTVRMFGKVILNIVQHFKPPEGVAGPVGIAQITHKFVQIGDFISLIVFMALISISLAVVNIMPFPALDGGRLIFLLFELITGKKPNARWEGTIHAIGLALLLGLIFLVTYNDIVRWIQG